MKYFLILIGLVLAEALSIALLSATIGSGGLLGFLFYGLTYIVGVFLFGWVIIGIVAAFYMLVNVAIN